MWKSTIATANFDIAGGSNDAAPTLVDDGDPYDRPGQSAGDPGMDWDELILYVRFNGGTNPTLDLRAWFWDPSQTPADKWIATALQDDIPDGADTTSTTGQIIRIVLPPACTRLYLQKVATTGTPTNVYVTARLARDLEMR